jgi:hypothetical protein
MTGTADHGLIVVSVARLEPLDERFSVVLGDMVHGLRSVLEYIAWTIVQRGSTPPVESSRQAMDVGMPIITEGSQTRGGWKAASRMFEEAQLRQLPGINPVHRSVIERYQPFKRGALAHDHPFALLQRLSNTDKHRRLHTPLFVPAQGSFRLNIPPGCHVKGMNLSPDVAAMNPLRVGMEVAYIVVENDVPCDGMTLLPTATLFIGLEDERGSALDLLVAIETLAGDLLLEIDAVL